MWFAYEDLVFYVITYLLQAVLDSRFCFCGRRQTKASQKWGPGSWLLKDGQGFGREKSTLKGKRVSKAVVAGAPGKILLLGRSHQDSDSVGLRKPWALPCPIHPR